MLIALSGLPGTGKTTIARRLAYRLPATHLRIDTIEQALLRAGLATPLGPGGYVIAYAVAADNLQLGHHVIADCVNSVQASRNAWEEVAAACEVQYLPVYLFCSDADEHRRRVCQRRADIVGHLLPQWEQVSASQFDPPNSDVLSIDTCSYTVEGAVDLIRRRIG